MEAMQGIIWLGISAGVISFTIAEMKIFAWLRDLAKKKSRFFGDLLSCFYCVGFWISAVICLIYQPNVINQIPVVDEVLTYFIVCGISGLWGLVMCMLFSLSNK